MPLNRKWFLFLILLLIAAGCTPAAADRQAEVAELGAEVMPFDLERTTHIFEKLPDGGRQQIVSDDKDSVQIELIRAHLAEEAGRFSEGDFHDPSMIHGEDMAGLHELVMGASEIRITYSDIDEGGQILYTTEDVALVEALHAWFDQQVADHGAHAQGQ